MHYDKPSVLIVHHNLEPAKVLASLLIDSCDVYVSKLPQRAREFLENNDVRLIIVSEKLAGTTGTDFLAEIKGKFGKTACILLASEKAAIDREDIRVQGIIDEVIFEPVDTKTLRETLRKYVASLKEAQDHKEVLDGTSESSIGHLAQLATPDKRDDRPAQNQIEEALELSSGKSIAESVTHKEAEISIEREATSGERRDPSPHLTKEKIRLAEEQDLLQEEVNQLLETVNRLQTEKFQLNNEKAELHELIQNLKQSISRRAEDRERLVAEVQEINEEITALEQKIVQLKQEDQAKREELDRLEKQLRKREQEKRSTENLRDILKPFGNRQIEQADRYASIDTRIIERYKIKLCGRDEQLAQFRETVNRLQQSCEQLRREYQSELNKNHKNYLALQRELEEYKRRCADLERENTGLSDKLCWIQQEWQKKLYSK